MFSRSGGNVLCSETKPGERGGGIMDLFLRWVGVGEKMQNW